MTAHRKESKMSLEDEKRVGAELRRAYQRRALTGKPDGFRIVFDVVETMIDIERRQTIKRRIDADRANSKGAPRLARPSWHDQFIRGAEACDESISEDEARARTGLWVTDDEVALARAIDVVFSDALPNEATRDSDWEMIKRVARACKRIAGPRKRVAGERKQDKSQRTIAADLGIPYGTYAKLDSRRGRAQDIWLAISHLMTDRSGTGTGRVLRVEPQNESHPG
jgi:hypothetical protein